MQARADLEMRFGGNCRIVRNVTRARNRERTSMALPNVFRVRQTFDRTLLHDPCRAVTDGLRNLGLAGKLPQGSRIAITAGSRGISNLVAMTRTAADVMKAMGYRPFIIPSMGSHGGATDEGQKSLLADLGISEDSMGCPVVSSMEVEEIGRTACGDPVYLDRNAFHADGIIAINRVKLHTIFRGDVESGLCKMLGVGLGKHKGAQHIHKVGTQPFLVETARVILAKAPVLAGIAVLENSLDETMEIHVVPPEQFEETDAALLKRSLAFPSTRWTSWWWTRWGRTSAAPAWIPMSSGSADASPAR
jgi:hypothetical protein